MPNSPNTKIDPIIAQRLNETWRTSFDSPWSLSQKEIARRVAKTIERELMRHVGEARAVRQTTQNLPHLDGNQ